MREKRIVCMWIAKNDAFYYIAMWVRKSAQLLQRSIWVVDLAQRDKKVLLPDVDAQANLAISFGYGRTDDFSDTLSGILQDMIDDNPKEVLVMFHLPYLRTSMIW